MTSEAQERAIRVLAEAGHEGASWWGPTGKEPSRIYFRKRQKNLRVYIAFAVPETLEGPTLCVDVQECRQPPSWFEGARRAGAKPYLEAYARLLGIAHPGLEARFRKDLEFIDMTESPDLLFIGGKTFK